MYLHVTSVTVCFLFNVEAIFSHLDSKSRCTFTFQLVLIITLYISIHADSSVVSLGFLGLTAGCFWCTDGLHSRLSPAGRF